MDDSYENDFEFLDLSNLDEHGRDELTAILKLNASTESVQLPWVKQENSNYHVLPAEHPVQQRQEEPKIWPQYEMEGNIMKYEAQPNAASSILLTVPSTIPYSQQIMPMYTEWPTNMYINNIASDPNVHPYMQGMAYPQNIYSPTNEPAPQQDMSLMREGGRRGRGRGNKNYNRNMNHSNEMQTGYMGEHSQYQMSMSYQPYLCVSEHTVAPQQHHAAAGQPIFFPSPALYHSSAMAQQQTHRVDYIPYHQSPTNTKHSRQSQSISPQTNGESTTKSTNHKSYEKQLQNVNISKPSINQSHEDDSNSSQTNIVTTVIVNNSNVESSVSDTNDENLTANNNSSNATANKKFDFKIEQHIVSTINDNYKGNEKNDNIPCVNIKSSIEVKQNGNDNKEHEEVVSHAKAPAPAPAASIPTPVASKPVAKATAPEDIQNTNDIKEAKEVKAVTEIKVDTSEPVAPVSASTSAPANKSWASILKKPSDPLGISANKPTAFITPNNTTVSNSEQVEQPPVIEKTLLPSKNSNNNNSNTNSSNSNNNNNNNKSFPEEQTQQKSNAPVDQFKTLNSNVTQIHCDDPITYRMGEFLLSYQMEKQTVSLLPRGLTNRSNYCYINSILQALLGCPPFYNLFMAMPYSKNPSRHSPSPLIDNMIKFVREFSPLPEGARLARKDRAQKRNEDAIVDIQSGVPFEPSYMYTILKNTSSPGVFSVEGRQEDAEEFLSCLLNGISDEMLELMKLANNNEQKSVDCIDTNVNYNQDEEEWKVMGPKNKGSITRSTDFGRTPLSDIFRGQLRSRVQRATEQATDYVQPFFTLQLDIEKAESVKSALEILVGKDPLEGMTCSKTKQQIEAWKQVTLEELPVILILHLKWFDYKPDGCSKILKSVEFPIDLKIDNKLMSMNARPKLSQKQRQYKLFAVTYHDGKEATKGHYVTDAFHVGYGGWVRYDDSSLKGVSEANVLNPLPPRVPYLLYYRRCDTIGNNQSNNVKAR